MSTPELLATLGHDMQWWKMCPLSLFEDWESFSETFPDSGIMQNGKLYRAGRLDHTTNESGCISLPIVPTPTASDGKGGHSPSIKRGHTHNLRDWFMLLYGFLYPPVNVVEYLMGFPAGWTDLDASAMP